MAYREIMLDPAGPLRWATQRPATLADLATLWNAVHGKDNATATDTRARDEARVVTRQAMARAGAPREALAFWFSERR